VEEENEEIQKGSDKEINGKSTANEIKNSENSPSKRVIKQSNIEYRGNNFKRVSKAYAPLAKPACKNKRKKVRKLFSMDARNKAQLNKTTDF